MDKFTQDINDLEVTTVERADKPLQIKKMQLFSLGVKRALTVVNSPLR